MSESPFRGIYTVIHRVPDIQAATSWYARAFGVEPYFEEPFYVGFDIAGYELGFSLAMRPPRLLAPSSPTGAYRTPTRRCGISSGRARS